MIGHAVGGLVLLLVGVEQPALQVLAVDEAHGAADEQPLIAQTFGGMGGVIDDERLIAHLELIEVDVGHTQFFHA